MTIYTYTFTIPGVIYLEDITKQLTTLNLTPDNINYSMDILTLIYNTDLPIIQQNILSNFFATYIPLITVPDRFYNLYSMQLVTNKINDIFYRLCGTAHFIIPNDTVIKSININFVSYGDNYTVRIYNFTTKTILNESPILCNTIRQINTINIPVPSVDSIIEMHIKVDNVVHYAMIESAQINLYVAN